METLRFLPKNASASVTGLFFGNGTVFSHFPHFSLHPNQTQLHFLKQEEIFQQLMPVKTILADFFDALSYSQFVAILFSTYLILSSLFQHRPKVVNAPYHGYRAWWEPTFLVQSRYIINARNIITDGYRKVKHPLVERCVLN
jgi:ent-kaurene oxidase